MTRTGSAIVGGTTFAAALALALAGLVLEPDTALYLDSGLALYPSPLGTLLGASLGPVGFAALHAAGVAAVVLFIARARPSFGAIGLAAPVLLWVLPLGVQAVSAALIVTAVALWPHRPRGVELVLLGTAFLHLAALPFLVCYARRWFALVAGGAVLAIMLGTPYGAAFPGEEGLRAIPVAIVCALAVVLLGLAPLLKTGVPPERGGGVALGAVAVFATAIYSVQADLVHRQADVGLALFAATRYALPLTAIALVLSAERRTERPKTAPGKGVAMTRLRAFGLSLVVTVTAALVLASVASAQTVPAIPVSDYGDSLLTSLASAIGQIFPYAAAITAFAIGVGMVKRWLGHRKATRV